MVLGLLWVVRNNLSFHWSKQSFVLDSEQVHTLRECTHHRKCELWGVSSWSGLCCLGHLQTPAQIPSCCKVWKDEDSNSLAILLFSLFLECSHGMNLNKYFERVLIIFQHQGGSMSKITATQYKAVRRHTRLFVLCCKTTWRQSCLSWGCVDFFVILIDYLTIIAVYRGRALPKNERKIPRHLF